MWVDVVCRVELLAARLFADRFAPNRILVNNIRRLLRHYLFVRHFFKSSERRMKFEKFVNNCSERPNSRNFCLKMSNSWCASKSNIVGNDAVAKSVVATLGSFATHHSDRIVRISKCRSRTRAARRNENRKTSQGPISRLAKGKTHQVSELFQFVTQKWFFFKFCYQGTKRM